MDYKCEKCGCTEFISQLNRYDIYEVRNEKIVSANSEKVDVKLILFCRDCSEELEFNEVDVEM